MATEEIKPSKITIAISAVKFINFETTTRLQEITSPIAEGGCEFLFNYKLNLREENQVVEFSISVSLLEKQSDTVKVELANLKALISFRIHNFDEIVSKSPTGFIIPNAALNLMLGLCHSTLRGMFAVCTKDMIIANQLIPIIDPKSFVQQPMNVAPTHGQSQEEKSV